MCLRAFESVPATMPTRATAAAQCPFSHVDTVETASGVDVDAIARELNGSLATQAGAWGRALLLQLAHPLVAAAVADHGYLLSDPDSGWPRLVRTVEVIQALMAGTPGEALRTARQLHFVHSGVKGRAAVCGHASDGASYSALDPALLRWVHATLTDSILRSHERFVRPLSTAERDAYCLASHRLGRLVGMREEDLPRGARDLREYMDAMLASDEVFVTDAARALAERLSNAPLPWPVRPLRRLAMLAGVGSLTRELQAAFGFDPGRCGNFSLIVVEKLLRGLHPLLPSMRAVVRFVSRSQGTRLRLKDLRPSLASG